MEIAKRTVCGMHKMKKQSFSLYNVICISLFIILLLPVVSHSKDQPPRYVGSHTCKECHGKEYASFMAYAKKGKSFRSIERLQKGLSEEDLRVCYRCHTTGYGKPGGFVSVEKTPHLKNAGCEVCHGPGEQHVQTKSPQDIKGSLSMEDCNGCHTSDRVKAFRYKPLIHGGAH